MRVFVSILFFTLVFPTGFPYAQEQVPADEPYGPWIICWENAPPPDATTWRDDWGWSYQRSLKNLDHLHVVIPLNKSGLQKLRERDIREHPPHRRRPAYLRSLWLSREDPHPAFLWAEPVRSEPARTEAFPQPQLEDPLLNQQWHLHNRGQSGGAPGQDANVFQAWRDGLSGEGVVVAIVDEGVEPDHEDLAANFNASLSFDYLDQDSDPSPFASGESHGMAVAGIVAAEGNRLGATGVAYQSRIASLRALEDRFSNTLVTTTTMGEVLNHALQEVDIYNNSWGYVASGGGNAVGFLNITASPTLQTALENGVRLGRGGLGSIYVWAAGNSGDFGGDVNQDQLIASPYTLSVGAIGDNGVRSDYSNRGAALHLTAPSSGNGGGITTLDLSGSRGVSPDSYRSDFGGTSAAAPIVSGTIALMLEANPGLTWRDVQEILVRTAARTDPEHPDWKLNGAGFYVNHDYGFGRPDAGAAVRLAQLWPGLPEEEEWMEASEARSAIVPAGSPDGATLSLDVEKNLRLEHVQLSLELETPDWGAMDILLISPAGTESRLSLPFDTTSQPSGSAWLFNTVRHRGESSSGRWRLRVASRDPSVEGSILSWALIFRGAAPDPFENPSPVPRIDRIQTLSDQGATPVLQNDFDPGGESLQLLSVERPGNGAEAWIGPGNAVNFQVDPAFRGRISLPYLMADASGNIARGRVEFLNPRPLAVDDSVGALPGSAFWFNPLENDIDADADPLQILSATLAGSAERLNLQAGSLKIFPEALIPGSTLNLQYTLSDNDEGTDSASVSIFIPEIRDFSISFPSDQLAYARVPPAPSLNLQNALSLEAWIHPTGYGEFGPSGFGRIFDRESFLLFLNDQSPFYADQSLVFFIRQADGTSTARYSIPESIQLNQWTHVAVTYDGKSDVRFYINGEPVPVNTPADDTVFAPLRGPILSSPEEDLYFGQNRSGDRGFQGRLDELRVWNRVRSPEEIADSFQRPLFGYEPGLVGYWPVIEARRNRLVERSGLSNHASFEGARWAEGILPGLAEDPWPEALNSPEGWRQSEWFGAFFADPSGWVYHERLGWVFPGEGSEASLFLYDDRTTSWFWTNRRFFPYLYRYDRQAWVYFDRLNQDDRYFFDFSIRGWEREPAQTLQ